MADKTPHQANDAIDLPADRKALSASFVALDLSLSGKNDSREMSNVITKSLIDLTTLGGLGDLAGAIAGLRGLPSRAGSIDHAKDTVWELAVTANKAPAGSDVTYSCAVPEAKCNKQPMSDKERHTAMDILLPGQVAAATLNQNRGIPISKRSAAVIGYLNVFMNEDKIAPEGPKQAFAELYDTKTLDGKPLKDLTPEQLVKSTEQDFEACIRGIRGDVSGCSKIGNHMGIVVRNLAPDAQYEGSKFVGKPSDKSLLTSAAQVAR